MFDLDEWFEENPKAIVHLEWITEQNNGDFRQALRVLRESGLDSIGPNVETILKNLRDIHMSLTELEVEILMLKQKATNDH